MMKYLGFRPERGLLYMRWEDFVINDLHHPFDIVRFKRLLYSTYFFFLKCGAYNSVLRDDLPILRLVCCFFRGEFAPQGCRESHYRCCQMFAEGLCRAVETGFERGYYKRSLPLSSHIAPDEADMSSFKAFSKHFDFCLKCFEEAYAESEEEYLDEEENE